MEKLKQIIDSGELRQTLERRFSAGIVEAVIDRVSKPQNRRCGHAAKLQAAEEMAKIYQAIKDHADLNMDLMPGSPGPLYNDLVAALTAWEKAVRGEG